MLEWLRGSTDPYDAQARLATAIAERGANQVAAEIAEALVSPSTEVDVRELALGLVGALEADVTNDALAVSLLVHLGAFEGEPADAAFMALARGIARVPDDERLYESVRAVARRARQPRHDARRGREWLARAVRAGSLPREAAERFDFVVDHPEPPSADDALFARASMVAEESERDALLAEVDVERLARVLVARGSDVDPAAPEAPRLAQLARWIGERLPKGAPRGALALVRARLHGGDFQLVLPVAIAAMADDEKTAKDALALVASGFESAPDVFTDEDVSRIVRAHALSAPLVKRLTKAVEKGRRAAG